MTLTAHINPSETVTEIKNGGGSMPIVYDRNVPPGVISIYDGDRWVKDVQLQQQPKGEHGRQR